MQPELTPSGRRRGHLVEVETKTAASVITVALPGSFRGYVDFWLLNDLVSDDCNTDTSRNP